MNDISVEELHKELDMVQNCINRMANNSFTLKGWLVILLVAAVALAPEQINKLLLLFIVISATCSLWYLDAYYLKQERLFRWKYEWIVQHRTTIKSSDNNRKFLYDLNPTNFNMWNPVLTKEAKKKQKQNPNYIPSENDFVARKTQNVFRIMFTISLTPIYLFVIFISVLLILWLR